jgi:hypothetical protein
MEVTRRNFLAKVGKASIFAVGAVLVPFKVLANTVNLADRKSNASRVCRERVASAPLNKVIGLRYLECYDVKEDEIVRRMDVLDTSKLPAEQVHVAWFWRREDEDRMPKIAIDALCNRLYDEESDSIPDQTRFTREFRKLANNGPIREPDVFGPNGGYTFI